jgi:hypothetical protein
MLKCALQSRGAAGLQAGLGGPEGTPLHVLKRALPAASDEV